MALSLPSVLGLVVVLLAQTEAPNPADPSGTPAASPHDSQIEQPIARVLGKEILLSELRPDEVRVGRWREQGLDVESESTKWIASALKQRIMIPLREAFKRDHVAALTAEELDAAVRMMKKKMEEPELVEQLKNVEGEITVLRREADDATASPEKKAEAAKQLKMKESLLGAMKPNDDMMRRTAGWLLGTWKTNQALYKKYGGRVIHQQVGPEPVEAYHRWLRERADAGDFVIHDEALNEEFWKSVSPGIGGIDVRDPELIFRDVETFLRVSSGMDKP